MVRAGPPARHLDHGAAAGGDDDHAAEAHDDHDTAGPDDDHHHTAAGDDDDDEHHQHDAAARRRACRPTTERQPIAAMASAIASTRRALATWRCSIILPSTVMTPRPSASASS